MNAKPPAPPLADLQRWVQEVIMHPGGAREGVNATATGSAYALSGQKAHSVIRRSKNLTSFQRIELYANMYFWRLLECLGNDFPSIKYALGEDEFEKLARAYLNVHPSRHYSLNFLGEHMAAYLRGRKKMPYHLFLSEVAELERAVEEVFDERNVRPLSGNRFSSVPPERWAGARLRLTPALRLLAFRYPINKFVDEVKQNKSPDVPKRKLSWVAVYRKDYEVWRMDLNRVQFAILSALVGGQPMGPAVEAGLEVANDPPEKVVASLSEWFQRWAGRGLFTGIVLD